LGGLRDKIILPRALISEGVKLPSLWGGLRDKIILPRALISEGVKLPSLWGGLRGGGFCLFA